MTASTVRAINEIDVDDFEIAIRLLNRKERQRKEKRKKEKSYKNHSKCLFLLKEDARNHFFSFAMAFFLFFDQYQIKK